MLTSTFDHLQDDPTRRRIAKIQKYLPKGRLFEVGPGSGKTLLALKNAGYEVCAIEHSEILAKQITDRTGIEVDHGDFDHFQPEQLYQAFLSFHVIEHVPDFMNHMLKAAAITVKGGYAFIATPHAASLEHLVSGKLAPNFSTAHLQLFSKDGMKSCLERSGWTLVEVDTPEYPVAWVRVATSILRNLKGKTNARPRGDYASRATGKAMILLKLFAFLSWPLLKIQESTHTGNELFVVARKV